MSLQIYNRAFVDRSILSFIRTNTQTPVVDTYITLTTNTHSPPVLRRATRLQSDIQEYLIFATWLMHFTYLDTNPRSLRRFEDNGGTLIQ